MTRALIVIASVLLAVGHVVADDAQPVEPIIPDPCPDVPFDAERLDYSVLAIYSQHPGIGPVIDPVTGSEPPPVPWDRLYHLQVIGTQSEFTEIFGQTGAAASGVDWHQSRLVVFLEFTTYQYYEIDSDSRLTGVYLLGDTILLRETSTNYGPCQGVAQDPESYSIGVTCLLLILPRAPERVTVSRCRVGDCPPDIP
jgi:hypothetical protein